MDDQTMSTADTKPRPNGMKVALMAGLGVQALTALLGVGILVLNFIR
jgi:hypothetical protein